MKRSTLIRHIRTRYRVEPEYLWAQNPDYAVFRHALGRKWFGVLMNVSGSRLGLADPAVIDILNLKARPEMVGALRQLRGILPAYHMNKEHWISVALDGGQDGKTLLQLLDDSYRLTR